MSGSNARWFLLLAVTLGLAVLAGVWYTGSRPSATRPPQLLAVYEEGVAGTYARVNPIFDSSNEVDRDLTALVFSGLTRLAANGEVQPDLAESWDISSDGLTYTFHLRQNVVWHDSEPFTADDVLFTIGALQDNDFRGPPASAELFRAITARKVDDLTVQIVLVQPFSPLLAHLSIGILPAHLLSDLDAGGLFTDAFNQEPVGTGPFRLTQLTPESAVLESNPRYYFGEPYIQRFELRFYNDEAALLKALKDDEIQGAFFRSPLNADDSNFLDGDVSLRVLQLPSTTYTILYFNDVMPPLQDKLVRQALAYDVDRTQIIDTVLNGQAVRADSPIPVGTWAYYPSLDRYTLDATEAERLLDEAGWRRQQNGQRAKDGQELRLNLVTNEDSTRIAVAEAIAREWTALGVQTVVSTERPTNLLRDTLMPHRFFVAIYGFDTGLDPDLYPAYHSSQTIAGSNNLSGFSDPQADILLQDARQTSDNDARKSLYRQFQELYAREMPSLPLYHRTLTYIVDRRLQGIEPMPLFDSGSRFTNIREWILETQ